MRGDNELIEVGAGSNVQKNSVLHNDIDFLLIIGMVLEKKKQFCMGTQLVILKNLN